MVNSPNISETILHTHKDFPTDIMKYSKYLPPLLKELLMMLKSKLTDKLLIPSLESLTILMKTSKTLLPLKELKKNKDLMLSPNSYKESKVKLTDLLLN